MHATPPPTCDWAASTLGSFSGSCLAFWAFVLPGSPGLGAGSCLAFWAFALQGSSRLGAGSYWAFLGFCTPRSEFELLAGSSPLATKSQNQGSPNLRHRTHCPRSRLAPLFSVPPRLHIPSCSGCLLLLCSSGWSRLAGCRSFPPLCPGLDLLPDLGGLLKD